MYHPFDCLKPDVKIKASFSGQINKRKNPDGLGTISYTDNNDVFAKLSFNGPCIMINGTLMSALLFSRHKTYRYFEFGADTRSHFLIEYMQSPELIKEVFKTSYIGEVKNGERHGNGKGFFDKKGAWFKGEWHKGRKVKGSE